MPVKQGHNWCTHAVVPMTNEQNKWRKLFYIIELIKKNWWTLPYKTDRKLRANNTSKNGILNHGTCQFNSFKTLTSLPPKVLLQTFSLLVKRLPCQYLENPGLAIDNAPGANEIRQTIISMPCYSQAKMINVPPLLCTCSISWEYPFISRWSMNSISMYWRIPYQWIKM